MLSQARRFVVFAALASLLTLSFAPSGAAQESGCVDQRDTDCDGDGVPYQYDHCLTYGPAYGDPPTDNRGCNEADGDSDYDGVLNKNDSCPSEGRELGDLDAAGCPTDRDGDNFLDHEDACPTEFGEGLDKPKAEGGVPMRGATGCPRDTGWELPSSVAEAPKVTKDGWSLTLVVNPEGVPAVTVEIEWDAYRFTHARRDRPLPDAPLASGVCKSGDWVLGENENGTNIEASGRWSCEGSFDQGGCVNDVIWVRGWITEDHKDDGTAKQDQFVTRGTVPLTRIERPGGPTSKPSCKGYNPQAVKKAVKVVKKAVARCKNKPADTKKQKRKRKKCIKKARA